MEYIIFANGSFEPRTVKPIHATKIIAANGGAQHCLKIGLQPDILIGDLDSINPQIQSILESAGAEIIRYPQDKDETDLELAINYAVNHGAKKITLFGLLGGRWDMSFANVMLLASPRFSQVEFHVLAPQLELFILHGGKSITITGKPGDPISVLPIGGNAQSISYTGLAWNLEKADLTFGSPLGVSNHMVDAQATIALSMGTLLIFHGSQIR